MPTRTRTHWSAAEMIQCGRSRKLVRKHSEKWSEVDCLRCLKQAFENDLPNTVWSIKNGLTYAAIGLRVDQVKDERNHGG